jgi:type IV pilus assembly protein PilB
LLDIATISSNTRKLISAEQAWHYSVIPAESTDQHVMFYIPEGTRKEELVSELELILNRKVELSEVPDKEFKRAINLMYRRNATNKKEIQVNKIYHESGSFFELLQEAFSLGSSDIHIEIYEKKARIRMRVDGQLIVRHELSKDIYPSLVNQIKIQSRMDIAEKRLPQDGRMNSKLGKSDVEFRVSALPTLYGEKIVMRILNRDSSRINLSDLGLSADQQKIYNDVIRKTNGIILISGPTGSGKTTTLYATLKELNKSTKNILTIEDPIEYTLEGINQVQLKESIGLDFAKALRTFLRQDPDIIMLGEIRDVDTAEMAVRASLTGHLVLSTIHTNSAIGIISRLIDMGIPSFLIEGTLSLAIAQRLVRKLCPSCKEHSDNLETNIENESLESGQPLFGPVGCEECHFTGYVGRKAIYEIIPISANLVSGINEKSIDVQEYFVKNGIQSLRMSAIKMLKEGETSLEEIYPILLDNKF